MRKTHWHPNQRKRSCRLRIDTEAQVVRLSPKVLHPDDTIRLFVCSTFLSIHSTIAAMLGLIVRLVWKLDLA